MAVSCLILCAVLVLGFCAPTYPYLGGKGINSYFNHRNYPEVKLPLLDWQNAFSVFRVLDTFCVAHCM
jgi:hypothetical protein